MAKAHDIMATDAAFRSVLTPEGVTIGVELADHGARAGALLVDLLIIVGTLLVAGVVLLFATFVAGSAAVALFFILSFFLRCPFFMYFELRWRGQTPGKRMFKLRVVDPSRRCTLALRRRGAESDPRGRSVHAGHAALAATGHRGSRRLGQPGWPPRHWFGSRSSC